MVKSLLRQTMKKRQQQVFDENNGPIDDWIKRTAVDDPCDEMMPMSKVKDKDYDTP